MYLNLSEECSGSPTQFIASCCNPGQDPNIDNCIIQYPPIFVRVNGSFVKEFDSIGGADVYTYFAINITNFDTCNGIALSLNSFIGVSTVELTIFANYPYLYQQYNQPTTQAMVFCCDILRQYIYTTDSLQWDGMK